MYISFPVIVNPYICKAYTYAEWIETWTYEYHFGHISWYGQEVHMNKYQSLLYDFFQLTADTSLIMLFSYILEGKNNVFHSYYNDNYARFLFIFITKSWIYMYLIENDKVNSSKFKSIIYLVKCREVQTNKASHLR